MRTLALWLLLLAVSPLCAHDHIGTSTGWLNGKPAPEDPRLLKMFEAADAARLRGDYKTMLELAHRAETQGSVWSRTLIGEAYMFGWGVPMDHAKAVEWIMKGFNGGDYLASQQLGILHARGIGIPHDHALARRFFQKLLNEEYNTLGKYSAVARAELAKIAPPAPVPAAARPKPSPVADKYVPGDQFRRAGSPDVTHQIVERDRVFRQFYYVIVRDLLPGPGRYRPRRVKMTEPDLDSLERVTDPVPFCLVCSGAGGTWRDAVREHVEYAHHGGDTFAHNIPYKDARVEPCENCKGTGHTARW